jgi:carboxynorspermidine decarboxylase
MKLETPYYLIDERKLLRNLKTAAAVRKSSGAKIVLALKCFSTWSVFPLMRKYLDGTTSSSLYEARLGAEKFGKETHAYCVGYSAGELKEVKRYADKIIFNSASQLLKYYPEVQGKKLGLRVNPGLSYSHFDLADPARKYSRLGVTDKKELAKVLPLISGVMFHFNCENDDCANLARNLYRIGRDYGDLLKKLEWVSLGGGIYFTKNGYQLEKFCATIKEFSQRFEVQVYLEPGETIITRAAELVTTVVDIVHNEKDIAVVDSSTEAHMLDLLIYRTPAKIDAAGKGRFEYMIAGRSCLAGDVFGTYKFRTRLRTGSVLRISDAAGYTMVKKNWFNGLSMPAIVIRKLDGTLETARSFTYKDFISSLS